ncbi:MAG: hypothetical protein KIG22_01920, partial [Oxalobacter sp.]|nr:hypothetical protein [Oxalobacter sp.]
MFGTVVARFASSPGEGAMQTGISGIVYRFGEAILSGAQKCRQKSTVPQTRLPDAGVRQDIV